MKTKIIVLKITLTFAAALFLNACGSSGSSGSSNFTLEEQVIRAKHYVVSNSSYKFNGQVYAGGMAVDLSDQTKFPVGQISTANIELHGVPGAMKIYQQPYSVVIATDFGGNLFEIEDVVGLETKAHALPTSGTATYTGQAFARNAQTGSLSYTVDFSLKTGSGSINGIATHGAITLTNAPISGGDISGAAFSSTLGWGEYELDFFGPQAEEIAGDVDNFGIGNDVGFAGRK